jgi:hypothetical protein
LAAGRPLGLFNGRHRFDIASGHEVVVKEPRLPSSSLAGIWKLRGLILAQTIEMVKSDEARCRREKLSLTELHEDSIHQLVLLKACDRFIFGTDSIEVRYHDHCLREHQPSSFVYRQKLKDLMAHIWRDIRDPASREALVDSTFSYLVHGRHKRRMIAGMKCSLL